MQTFPNDRVIKKQRIIESPASSFSAAICLHLAHFWPGLYYMSKAKYKTIRNG